MPELITTDQLRALHAAARKVGLDHDGLRAAAGVPSLKQLTRPQASALLDRLNANTLSLEGRGQGEGDSAARCPRFKAQGSKRRPRGVHAFVTPGQRAKIEALRVDLRWSTEGLAGFLSERRFDDGRRLADMASSNDARIVIELLKEVLRKTRAKGAQRRGTDAAP